MIEFARPFVLQRDRDVTGVSGTGTVADGVVWPDGTVALRWRGRRPSSVTWDSIDDALSVHGHDGATRVVWSHALLVATDPPDGRSDDGPATDDDASSTPALDALRAGQRVWQGPVEGYGTGHMLGLLGTLNGTECTEADPCPIHADTGGALPLLVARCDASMLGFTGAPVGPCTLRHDHDGPVHQAADGAKWWATEHGRTIERLRAALDDEPTTAVTEQPTPDDVAVAAELRSIADALVADAATYPGAGANWHNGVEHAVRAMQARADWMDHRNDERADA